jgi:hypothetical protein
VNAARVRRVPSRSSTRGLPCVVRRDARPQRAREAAQPVDAEHVLRVRRVDEDVLGVVGGVDDVHVEAAVLGHEPGGDLVDHTLDAREVPRRWHEVRHPEPVAHGSDL